MKILKVVYAFVLLSLSLQSVAAKTSQLQGEDLKRENFLSNEENIPNFKCKLSRVDQISSGFQVGLDKYCSCFISINSENGKISYTNGYNFCAERFCNIELRKIITDEDLIQNFQKPKGETEVTSFSSSHLCTAKDSRGWFRDYNRQQKAAVKNLAERVDEQVCGSKTHHFNSATKKTNMSLVKKCRDPGLRKLVEDYLPGIFDSCDSDHANKGKKRRVNDCSKRKAYSMILSAFSGDYFYQFCSKKLKVWGIAKSAEDIKNVEDCSENLNKTLVSVYYKKELKVCTNETLFNTPGAIKTCRNVLLEKTLGFTSDDQLNGISECLDKSGTEEVVKSCVGDILISPVGNDIDEKQLLEDLEKKYCSVKKDSKGNTVKELSDKESKDCLKQLVINNLDEVAEAEECMNLPSAAKTSCQRKLIFKKLLADKSFDVEDCWNEKKYDTIEKRRECSERASKVALKAEQCEQKTTIPDQIKCFQKIKDKKFTSSYLLRKYGMFFKKCDANKSLSAECSKKDAYLSCKDQPSDKLQTCLLNLMDQKLLAQLSDTNQECLQAIDANDCFEKKKRLEMAETGGLTPGTSIAGKNGSDANITDINSTAGGLVSEVNFVNDGKGTDKNKSDVFLTSNVEQPITSGSSGSVANASDFSKKNDSGIAGLFKDFKYMGLRDANPTNGSSVCRSMKRAAYLRAGGLVVGVLTIVMSGVAAKKHIDKNKDDKQNSSLEAMGIVSAGVVAGVGIKLGANLWAKNMVSGAITEETMRRNMAIASGAPPESTRTYCTSKKARKSQKQSYTDENNFFYEGDVLKSVTKSTVAQMNASKSEEDLALLYAEWEAFKDGEPIFNPENDQMLSYLSNEKSAFDTIKTNIVNIVSFTGGLLMPKAHAEITVESITKLGPLLQLILASSIDGSKAEILIDEKGKVVTDKKDTNTNVSTKDALKDDGKNFNTNPEFEKVTKQLDKLEKMDALALLMDYGDMIGVDVDAYTAEGQNARKKESLMKDYHSKFLEGYGKKKKQPVEENDK